MVISILIVLAVMFLVFMCSLKNISDSAKSVTLGIGILLVGYILFKTIKG